MDVITNQTASCPLKVNADLLRARYVEVDISNGVGEPWSDPYQIKFVADLPRLLSLHTPNLLIGGLRTDVILSGTDLDAMGDQVSLYLYQNGAQYTSLDC